MSNYHHSIPPSNQPPGILNFVLAVSLQEVLKILETDGIFRQLWSENMNDTAPFIFLQITSQQVKSKFVKSRYKNIESSSSNHLYFYINRIYELGIKMHWELNESLC